MININLSITNSFNKKENQEVKKNNILDNFPVQNQNFNKVSTETNSLSVVSLTNNIPSGFVISGSKDEKPSIWRDILIGAAGSVIGAIITYLILGIK